MCRIGTTSLERAGSGGNENRRLSYSPCAINFGVNVYFYIFDNFDNNTLNKLKKIIDILVSLKRERTFDAHPVFHVSQHAPIDGKGPL
jgi:hypothetical protein